MKRKLKIFDTTLRAGEQAPGCSMNLHEKIEVARRLELLRADVIEAGVAASSPGDFKAVTAVAENIRNCSVASLARCSRADIDAAWEALKRAASPRIHVFIATSDIHMRHKLKMSPDQVAETAESMVRYARSLCPDVEFSAEDAMRSDPDFLARVVRAAIRGGAGVVNIPDRVGYSTPQEMRAAIERLRASVPECGGIDLSVHCHNDLGMATANTLAGILGGATQAECTINGLGERAGNAPMEEVVMAIRTRPDLYPVESGIDIAQIYMASKTVYGIIGRAAPFNKPIVGANAFAHEAGIHQHGVLADRSTYEIMTPEAIGIPAKRMVLGKHSGRHAFQARLAELGFELKGDEFEGCFNRFKELCDKKKEVSDRDIEALVRNLPPEESGAYRLKGYSVHARSADSGGGEAATAVIALEFGGEAAQEVALGNGPIDAAYKAVDKIINPPEYIFEDYTIQSVSEGKDSLGEVKTTLSRDGRFYTGRGLSTDIIEASILAYINAQNKLMENYRRMEEKRACQ